MQGSAEILQTKNYKIPIHRASPYSSFENLRDQFKMEKAGVSCGWPNSR